MSVKCTCGAWSNPNCKRPKCILNFRRDLISGRMPSRAMQRVLWDQARTDSEWRHWLNRRELTRSPLR